MRDMKPTEATIPMEPEHGKTIYWEIEPDPPDTPNWEALLMESYLAAAIKAGTDAPDSPQAAADKLLAIIKTCNGTTGRNIVQLIDHLASQRPDATAMEPPYPTLREIKEARDYLVEGMSDEELGIVNQAQV